MKKKSNGKELKKGKNVVEGNRIPYRLTCPIYPRVIGHSEVTEEELKMSNKAIEELLRARKENKP